MQWKDARAYCERVKGATLVSLDDKEEEEYVTNIMKSKGVDRFHTWSGISFGNSSKVGFVCEYRLGEMQGLIHFESEINSSLVVLTNLFLQCVHHQKVLVFLTLRILVSEFLDTTFSLTKLFFPLYAFILEGRDLRCAGNM